MVEAMIPGVGAVAFVNMQVRTTTIECDMRRDGFVTNRIRMIQNEIE